MNRYEKTLQRLFSLTGTSSLQRVEKAAEILAFPHRAFPCIHIAGTNGKGSVATKIAKILEYSGYRVGLYTSPHLFCFRERIQIRGEPIPEEAVVHGMEKLFSLSAGFTLFELTTLLAFDYFRAQQVDVAIIEAGLGGQLDATNIVLPLLSIITSISRDHTEVLGESLEAIAFEKAGIIKPRIPVVIGPQAQFAPIFQKARETNSPLEVAAVPGGRGFYDEENRAIAAAAIPILERYFTLLEAAKIDGLNVRPPCRFETCQGAILDVAHNPEGFRRLFEALRLHFPQRPLRVLLGLSEDKEIDLCLGIAAAQAVHIHLVQADSKRAASAELLASRLRYLGYPSFSIEKSISSAVRRAAREQELLVVCGSFFIMRASKRAILDPIP